MVTAVMKRGTKQAPVGKSARIITVCSPKGGVGKTTLTRCLLVAGAQAGLSVIGVDFDPQQSLRKWAGRREMTRRALPNEKFANVPVEAFDMAKWREQLAMYSRKGLVVIDTPPGVEANLPAIRGMCQIANLVLVPTGTTRDDLDSVLPWMKELLEAKIHASFVLNRVNRRTNSFTTSRTRLIRVGPVCPIEIPALEEIHAQSDNGLTVLDLVKSRGHEPMEGLWHYTTQETLAP